MARVDDCAGCFPRGLFPPRTLGISYILQEDIGAREACLEITTLGNGDGEQQWKSRGLRRFHSMELMDDESFTIGSDWNT